VSSFETQTRAQKELAVVMPAWNEQESIRVVVEEWVAGLRAVEVDFDLMVIDDGSTDSTPWILERLAKRFPELRVMRKDNSGHGQSCVYGYRLAANEGYDWIFQIDSDGQCDPRFFPDLWARRGEGNAVFGDRARRDDGRHRRLISKVVSLVTLAAGRVWLRDANTPYRLMRSRRLAALIERIPEDIDLANIAVAALFAREGEIVWAPITFRKRHGGQPSVSGLKFAKKGRRLCTDLKRVCRNGSESE
jgi:glycosyltransferase involved in cell wall biosynthesis